MKTKLTPHPIAALPGLAPARPYALALTLLLTALVGVLDSEAALYSVELIDNDGPHITGVVDTAADTFTIYSWTENPGGTAFWSASDLPRTYPARTSAGPFDVPDNWNGTMSGWGFLNPSNWHASGWNEGTFSIDGSIFDGWGIGLVQASYDTPGVTAWSTLPPGAGTASFDTVTINPFSPRSSANYSISAETMDGGGGASSSANYTTQNSIEPGTTGGSSSANYSVQHGFLAGVLTPVLPPPTAARLAYFKATRSPEGAVDLAWQSLVEVRMIGYLVERFDPLGQWVPVGQGLIPARGQERGTDYSAGDEAAPDGVALLYRLIEVDLEARRHVLAQATVSAGLRTQLVWNKAGTGLELTLAGEPGQVLLIEAARRVDGPWEAVERVALGAQGTALFDVPLNRQQPMLLLRVSGEK